jgi:NADH:ubiquinone reductase (non-electrogenic)
LKELSDARAIRQKIIDAFERASTPALPEAERKRLLHFVVVGGGPTGVEFAGEMHDFFVEDLCKIFPELMKDVCITLVEAADHILTSFDEALSKYTSKQFRRRGIEVQTSAVVTKVDKNSVYLKDGTDIPYGVLVWSTGLAPTPLVRSLPFPKDRNLKIVTDEYLRVQGYLMIYALGDCATISGKNLPATGQVAQQEGGYIARSLNRVAKNMEAAPFRYKHWGMLAYIGGNRALADLSSFKGRGFTAWLFWRSAYLTRMVSLKNKILVAFDWLKTIVFGRDISRF